MSPPILTVCCAAALPTVNDKSIVNILFISLFVISDHSVAKVITFLQIITIETTKNVDQAFFYIFNYAVASANK